MISEGVGRVCVLVAVVAVSFLPVYAERKTSLADQAIKVRPAASKFREVGNRRRPVKIGNDSISVTGTSGRPSGSRGTGSLRGKDARQDQRLKRIEQRLQQLEELLGVTVSGDLKRSGSYSQIRSDIREVKKDLDYLQPLVNAERKRRAAGRTARKARNKANKAALDAADNVRGKAREAKRTAGAAAKNASRAARRGADGVRQGVERIIPGGK